VGGDCVLADSSVTTRDTGGIDPNPGSSSSNVVRRSFTVSPVNGFIYVVLNNTDGSNAHTFHLTVSETTMFSPTWSTFTPFQTEWGFMNTTGTSINGVLTVTDSISGGPYTKSFSVQAGKVLFMTTGSTFSGGPIPANHNGGAYATHDGPPGALMPVAYL